MVGTVEAVSLGMDALQTYFGKIQTELKLVRQRPAPSRWHYAHMEGVATTAAGSKPDAPTWTWANPRKDERIAIRRIQVILDDEPSSTYKPDVQVSMNGVEMFRSKSDAFKDADLDLDLAAGDGGKYLEVGESVEVRVWNALADADETSRRVTVYLQAGEA